MAIACALKASKPAFGIYTSPRTSSTSGWPDPISFKGIDEYTDFRDQEIAPGIYTLRYGLQPEDGNHLGTSDTYDFILALPAKYDTKPATIEDFYELSERSGKAAGSTHPAIFSLLDPAKAGKETKLEEDTSNDDWVLTFTAKGDAKGKASEVKIRLVVIGISEA